jgi:hypothetical protein
MAFLFEGSGRDKKQLLQSLAVLIPDEMLLTTSIYFKAIDAHVKLIGG